MSDSPAMEPAPTTPVQEGAVRLRGLVKTYGHAPQHPAVAAVRGIDLDIRNGELMVLVGPSGCGKSTTLRLIAGLEDATSGTVEIGGRMVNDLEPKDRGIAMVFQNYALYPHMTVFDNLAFALKLAKRPKEEIRQAVLRAAAALGLEPLLQRRPQALSGGQRQRVALGRALVRNPRVFLFDEPLSNLDAQMRGQMRSEISRLHARLQTTMVYVTHDQVEAMTLGDRICVMNEGTVMQVADPLTLYSRPNNRFVAGFIGSPPMNFLPGRVQRRQDNLWFVPHGRDEALAIPMRGPLAERAGPHLNQELVLGIRPEHLGGEARRASAAWATFCVDLVEQMGAESILHLRKGDFRLLVRVFGEHRYRPGGDYKPHLDFEQILLFDAATGLALTHG